jgi:hypothetical protein
LHPSGIVQKDEKGINPFGSPIFYNGLDEIDHTSNYRNNPYIKSKEGQKDAYPILISIQAYFCD